MKIVIIGGGASGMMAACFAATTGNAVTLLERNRILGIKLNLTGKGRCNITNECDVDTLIKNTPGNGRFLYSAFSEFTPAQVMEFFETVGVPVKTERGNRVFPQSESAKDVTAALVKCMKDRGVRVVTARARSIEAQNGTVCQVNTDGGIFAADRVILATGGLSYPRTGSDGDGYLMAKTLGHTIMPTKPSLVALVGDKALCSKLEGLSLRNVKLTVYQGEKKVYDDFGEMIFTENGVSGPLILSASAHLAHKGSFESTLSIDLKPALTPDMLNKRILRDFEENLNRDFANAISKLLPAKLIPIIVERSGIAPNQKVNVITKKQREQLCALIKGFTIDITSAASYHEAVVTAGGVSIKEINPKTMESKLVQGLYFAGEIIDVDSYTGGFNLQIAWSTAYKAATNACEDA